MTYNYNFDGGSLYYNLNSLSMVIILAVTILLLLSR